VNAFEQPIRARKNSGYAEPSALALATYWEQVDKAYRLQQPIVSVLNPRGYELPSQELTKAQQTDLNAWVNGILLPLSEGQA
ncbi:MAG: type I-E CRISPR-associated protein Cas7/Cse4/CasC, partial [Anaerolineae bacterium]|nr:type I-E CRISPR-associated protein Cas7/Cse4/CasC [Anaerolineae bacterium]